MRGRGGGIAGNPVLIGAATVLVILVAVFLSYNANKGLPFVPTYQLKAEVPERRPARRRQRRQDRRHARRRGHRDQAAPLDDGTRDRRARPHARQGRRPAAEGLDADRPAAVRARPQVRRDHPRPVAASFQDGDTIPLAQAETPVELDEFLNMFDEDTRAASQVNLEGFGPRSPGAASRSTPRSAPSARCCATSSR